MANTHTEPLCLQLKTILPYHKIIYKQQLLFVHSINNNYTSFSNTWTKNTDRQLNYGHFQNIEIQSLNIQNRNISNMDIQSRDIQSMDIKDMNISSRDIQSMDIQNMDIQSMDIQSRDIQSTYIQDMNISSMDIQNMNISSMNISSMNISSMDIQNMNIQSMDIQSMNIQSDDVTYVSPFLLLFPLSVCRLFLPFSPPPSPLSLRPQILRTYYLADPVNFSNLSQYYKREIKMTPINQADQGADTPPPDLGQIDRQIDGQTKEQAVRQIDSQSDDNGSSYSTSKQGKRQFSNQKT